MKVISSTQINQTKKNLQDVNQVSMESLPGKEGRHFVIVLDYSEKIQNTISVMRKVAKTLLQLVTSRDKVKFNNCCCCLTVLPQLILLTSV